MISYRKSHKENIKIKFRVLKVNLWGNINSYSLCFEVGDVSEVSQKTKL